MNKTRRETDRQTGRQTQTDRQRQTDRQIDRQRQTGAVMRDRQRQTVGEEREMDGGRGPLLFPSSNTKVTQRIVQH